MDPATGLVAFSFGLGHVEPNPCNVRIAKEAERIVAQENRKVIVVAQWEVDLQLQHDSQPPALSVEKLADGSYLGSEEVWEAAKLLFKEQGITEIIPVAQTFLHLWKIKQMITRDGFTVIARPIGKIGFDKESTQWWCRGPIQLAVYSAMQLVSGYRGHHGKQSAA